MTAADEWKRYWPLVFAATIGLSFHSVMTAFHGIYMGPVTAETGWGRGQITLGPSLASIITTLASPLMGVAIDRWGTRRFAVPGLLAKACVVAAFGLMSDSIVQWIAMWAIYALVGLTTKYTVWTSAIAGVFSSSRGMALGIVLSGSAIAQIIVPPLGNWLITEYGWRVAFAALGIIWGSFAFLLCLFFLFDAHDHFRTASATARKAGKDQPDRPDLPGMSIAEAWRSVALWRIAISTFIMMLLTIGLMVHQFPILVEVGVSRSNAALLASLAGASAVIGKIITGWLLDRYRPNWIGGLTLGSAAIAFALLLETFDLPVLIIIAMVINGYASGTKLQICGYLTTRYAGMRNFATIFGVMSSLIVLGSGIGPVIGGYIHDFYGSYVPFLIIGIIGSLISGLLIFGLDSYPDWDAAKQAAADG